MPILTTQPGTAVTLAASSTVPEMVHLFSAAEIHAVNAALAARRPLLVRGEPGIGKSQLARAAAKGLRRAFVSHVVDSRTESRDLLWHFDAIARLADAQLFGALGDVGVRALKQAAPDHRQCGADQTGAADATPDPVRAWDALEANAKQRLAVSNYIQPRALWWAFDWQDARTQAEAAGLAAPQQPDGGSHTNGVLLLIDEIDKAESDVPNGLLEALGSGSFTPQGLGRTIHANGEPPLVVITTNEERTLPDAFLRRCLVLHLTLPPKGKELVPHLVDLGRAHFPAADADTLLRPAAELLAADRETARREHLRPLPGQAEYLDLVRAVVTLGADPELTDLSAEDILTMVQGYVLKKHPEMGRTGSTG